MQNSDDNAILKEQIAEDIINMLLFEAKELLFPQRNCENNQFSSNENSSIFGPGKQMFPR